MGLFSRKIPKQEGISHIIEFVKNYSGNEFPQNATSLQIQHYWKEFAKYFTSDFDKRLELCTNLECSEIELASLISIIEWRACNPKQFPIWPFIEKVLNKVKFKIKISGLICDVTNDAIVVLSGIGLKTHTVIPTSNVGATIASKLQKLQKVNFVIKLSENLSHQHQEVPYNGFVRIAENLNYDAICIYLENQPEYKEGVSFKFSGMLDSTLEIS